MAQNTRTAEADAVMAQMAEALATARKVIVEQDGQIKDLLAACKLALVALDDGFQGQGGSEYTPESYCLSCGNEFHHSDDCATGVAIKAVKSAIKRAKR